MRCATTTAAALLLLFATYGCGGGGEKSEKESRPAAKPGRLGDGTLANPMPDALRRFRGLPVTQAKELPAQAAELLCSSEGTPAEGRSPVAAWMSTDGLSVVYAVGDTRAYTCEAVWDGEHWEKCAFTLTENLTQAGEAAVCDDVDPPRGFVWVTVPQGVAWALVDHGSFWVAYLAANRPILRVSATEGASEDGLAPTRMVFVNQRGRVLEERALQGDRAEG